MPSRGLLFIHCIHLRASGLVAVPLGPQSLFGCRQLVTASTAFWAWSRQGAHSVDLDVTSRTVPGLASCPALRALGLGQLLLLTFSACMNRCVQPGALRHAESGSQLNTNLYLCHARGHVPCKVYRGSKSVLMCVSFLFPDEDGLR